MIFSELEYAAKKKVTRRDRFLAEINAVTPWRATASALRCHWTCEAGRSSGQPNYAMRSKEVSMPMAPKCTPCIAAAAPVIVELD